MEQEELFEKLDALQKALPSRRLLDFRFSNDQDHDNNIIDWFADGGEIRAYKEYKSSFHIDLCKGDVIIYLGLFSKTMDDSTKLNQWKFNYLKKFWDKNKNIVYCTNNLLNTPDEIIGDNIRINDETFKYKSDGSFTEGNIFHLSKHSSLKSFKKGEIECRETIEYIYNEF